MKISRKLLFAGLMLGALGFTACDDSSKDNGGGGNGGGAIDNNIYTEVFGETPATGTVSFPVPNYDEYNTTGSGATTVTYTAESSSTTLPSIRNNVMNDMHLWLPGTTTNSATINNITVGNKKNFKLSYKVTGDSELELPYELMVSNDGANWKFVRPEMKTPAESRNVYVDESVEFTVTSSKSSLYLQFGVSANASGVRIDTLKLVELNRASSNVINLDEPTTAIASATTGEASKLTTADGTTATVEGSYSVKFAGDATITYGFEYKTTTDGTYASVDAADAAAGKFSSNLTGLTVDTEYTYRAWVKVGDADKVYGTEATFTPEALPADAVTVTADFNFTGEISGVPTGSTGLAGDEVNFTMDDATFTISSCYKGTTASANYLMLTKNATNGGGYVILPSIKDKVLSDVTITTGSGASVSVQVALQVEESEGNWVEVETKTLNVQGTEFTYTIATKTSSRYRLRVVSNHNSQVSKLVMSYVDAE